MVSGSEVRVICPSVSFFFARLGVALGVSGDFLPLVGDFVFAGCGLSVVIGELSPILGQSLAWFEGETRRMAEVRSSELETGLSSSGGPEGGDTAVSAPRVVRAFHTLEEVCGLDEETVSRFKDRFQFPNRVRVRRPTSEDRACHFFPGEVCFYEAAFTCGLRLPVHPFIMELLGFLGIASRATYAQFLEDRGQLYGNMVGCERGYDQSQ